jgi:hypothetical protein
MTEPVRKRLTVTFKAVAVEVASLGEDYGSTVASVVTRLIPSFRKTKLKPRVSLTDITMCLHQLRQADVVQQYILQNISGQVRPGEMVCPTYNTSTW